jgi:hypothetical protein
VGGNGLSSDYSGSSITYSGGGGGHYFGPTNVTNTRVPGGSGGGGQGAFKGSGGFPSLGANAGTNGLGGGGGGAGGDFGTPRDGKAGGNGVVVIRYPDSYPLASSTDGSPTVTTSGSFRRYVWTVSGSITF